MVPLNTAETFKMEIPIPSFSFSSNSLFPMERLWISKLWVMWERRVSWWDTECYHITCKQLLEFLTCGIRISPSQSQLIALPLRWDIWHAEKRPVWLQWSSHSLRNQGREIFILESRVSQTRMGFMSWWEANN